MIGWLKGLWELLTKFNPSSSSHKHLLSIDDMLAQYWSIKKELKSRKKNAWHQGAYYSLEGRHKNNHELF